MTKIFLDTNLFLALYETDGDIREIFGDLHAIRSHLVFPEQVRDEFVRNRDRALESQVRQVKAQCVTLPPPTSLIAEIGGSALLQQLAEDYNRSVQELAAGIRQLIIDPARDPVFSALAQLYGDPAVTTLRRTPAIVDRAHQRKLIGNPPKSERKNTIGDELIWEMLLADTGDDLILVTRDSTFINHVTFLADEYAEATGRTLLITDHISAALAELGTEPSPALLRFEGEPAGGPD
jgi:predicted nucleic acid-binding protein